jgi:hypothetical protein
MKRLEKHPHMIARITAMLDVAENTSGDVELARDAEEKICEEITKMGYEMLTMWGEGQESKKRKIYEERINAIKHGKKKLTGKPN